MIWIPCLILCFLAFRRTEMRLQIWAMVSRYHKAWPTHTTYHGRCYALIILQYYNFQFLCCFMVDFRRGGPINLNTVRRVESDGHAGRAEGGQIWVLSQRPALPTRFSPTHMNTHTTSLLSQFFQVSIYGKCHRLDWTHWALSKFGNLVKPESYNHHFLSNYRTLSFMYS